MRGRDVLRSADVVVYDRLMPESLLKYAPRGPNSFTRVSGPAASNAVRGYGLEPTVEAAPHTVEAWIDAIVEWEK